MSTTLIKFEVTIPTSVRESTAYATFQNAIAALGPVNLYQAYGYDSSGNGTNGEIMHGLITPAQAASALSLLNTLNAALGSNVTCVSYNVTSQP